MVARLDSIVTLSCVCLSLHPRNRLEEKNAIPFHKPPCLLKGTSPLAGISITHLDHECPIICRQIHRGRGDQGKETFRPTNVGSIIFEVSERNIGMLKSQFASILLPERFVVEQFLNILVDDSDPLIATRTKSQQKKKK